MHKDASVQIMLRRDFGKMITKLFERPRADNLKKQSQEMISFPWELLK